MSVAILMMDILIWLFKNTKKTLFMIVQAKYITVKTRAGEDIEPFINLIEGDPEDNVSADKNMITYHSRRSSSTLKTRI